MSGVVSTLSDFLGWSSRASDQVTVIVQRGNRAWAIDTWTSVIVRLGIEIMPWTAELSMTAQAKSAVSNVDINEGDSCRLYIGGNLVFTGYVQTIVEELSPEDHTFNVQLASKSIDLVECAAEFSTFQMNSTNVINISQRVCDFSGIKVISVNGAGDTDIGAFSVILTETAYEVIERLTRIAGVLFYDRPDGNICLSGVGEKRSQSGFAIGKNIERIQKTRSMNGRYSDVTAICTSMATLFETPNENALVEQMKVQTSPAEAHATDFGVSRTRNMLVPIEVGDIGGKIAKQRVQWEVNRRLGRAYPISLTCDSWRDDAGQLWMPNMRAPVRTANGDTLDLLIGELVLRQTVDDGTHADVVLMDPVAFTPEPIVNPIYQNRGYVALMNDEGQKSSADPSM